MTPHLCQPIPDTTFAGLDGLIIEAIQILVHEGSEPLVTMPSQIGTVALTYLLQKLDKVVPSNAPGDYRIVNALFLASM